MFRPKLTKFASSNPFAKAISQLNRAVSDQAGTSPGPGLGMMTGPSGRQVYLNAPTLMYAKSGTDGIPASEDDADGNRMLGKADVYAVRLARDDSGDCVLKVDQENPIKAYNMGLSSVGGSQYLVLAKILNVWQVIWEECDGSS
ncbi:MAG: hypothetical protein P4L67_04805 [Candidatus Pacebacteria bacterium]|nr:hypothetical protein [Candidatus Paceibacterota bacterium]